MRNRDILAINLIPKTSCEKIIGAHIPIYFTETHSRASSTTSHRMTTQGNSIGISIYRGNDRTKQMVNGCGEADRVKEAYGSSLT